MKRLTAAALAALAALLALGLGFAAHAQPSGYPADTLPKLDALLADRSIAGQVINSATSNAAVTSPLGYGQATVGYVITGLTASGATLTPEYTNDPTLTTGWTAGSIVQNGALGGTITADGSLVQIGAPHAGVRLRVSTTGTGNITISSNASAAAIDPLVYVELVSILAKLNGTIAISGSISAATSATASSTPTAVSAGVGKPLNIDLFSELFMQPSFGGVPLVLGSATSASSMPVVIASDQAAVAVKQATASALNATVVGAGGAAVATSALQTSAQPGFTDLTTGTPISVTTGGVPGTLPAGAVVVATNVGATNGAYCKLGASATTSDQYLSPSGGWFAFQVGSATQLTCITSAGTTTVNMTGGSGLATGTGGGGGSGGGAVTVANGADVALGSTTDSPCTVPTTSAACTLSATLKALTNLANSAIAAGANIIGKVGIDQTTPGTTNGVVATPPISTYQGTLSVSSSAAISTLTLSNSTTYPVGAQGVVNILNTGSNTAYVCFFGGTCSATGGSFPLVAGASKTLNLGSAATAPTVFSTSGTTLAINN
jgi:hypothetical protein